MKRLILASVIAMVAAPALANTYTCSGHGVTNTVEYNEYAQDLTINGIEFIQDGSGKDNGGGIYQQSLKAEFPALAGNHQIIITYMSDWRHPVTVVNVEGLEATNGYFSAEQLTSVATYCKNNRVKPKPVYHAPKPKPKPPTLDDFLDKPKASDFDKPTQPLPTPSAW